MIEVEIKAKVKDFSLIKKQLEKLGAEFLNKEKQIDAIFGRKEDLDNEHKIIEGHFSARVREKGDKRLVEFKEIRRGAPGMEFSSPVVSLESGINFLEKLGFEKAFTISKVRENYKYNDFEICLDDVDELGSFIEIEHPCKDGSKQDALKECEDLLGILAPDAVIEPKKYGDLMQEIINKK